MKAYVFPGQGAQYPGMGKDLYDNSPVARELFDKANEILGFETRPGNAESLRSTTFNHGGHCRLRR